MPDKDGRYSDAEIQGYLDYLDDNDCADSFSIIIQLTADLAAARAEIERVREATIERCAQVCHDFASAARASTIGQIDPVRTAMELEASIRALSRPATGGAT